MLLLGCKGNTDSKYKGLSMDTVVVNMERPIQKNVRNYFSQLEIIPLETNSESIIHDIDRIVTDDNFLYILDRARGAILIFDKNGYFIQKIDRKGRGPEEYTSLIDFAFNRSSGQFSVVTDRPGNLIKYDLNGRFVNSEKLPVLFEEIANYNGQDVLFNTRKQDRNNNNYYLWFKSDKEYTKRLPVEKTNSIYPQGPLIVESQHICFTGRYDNVIMKIMDEDAVPLYYLDFGKHWLSDGRFADNEQNIPFFTSESHANKICHTIFMVRDMKDYLVFRTNLPGFVIYNKQNRTADYLRALQDDETGCINANYFAHDGNDQKMMFTLSPNDLRAFSKFNGIDSSVNRRRILDIASTIEDDANPVLLFYTFK